jgi:hypothetical protein
VVGRAGRELSAQRELIRVSEAPFGNLVADLAREYSGAQIALFNAGGFRASIPAGEVRLKEIYQAFPFRNELVTGILSGAELQAALDHSAGLDPRRPPRRFPPGLRSTAAHPRGQGAGGDPKRPAPGPRGRLLPGGPGLPGRGAATATGCWPGCATRSTAGNSYPIC